MTRLSEALKRAQQTAGAPPIASEEALPPPACLAAVINWVAVSLSVGLGFIVRNFSSTGTASAIVCGLPK